MKRRISLVALFMFLCVISFAQKKVEEVKFQTSAVCGMCKSKIEKNLSLKKGVKSAHLSLEDKVCTVKFNPNKISAEELKAVISNTGYAADELPANEKAFNNLSPCCQKKEGAEHEMH